MQKMPFFVGSIALLVLVGAGCSNGVNTNTKTTDNETQNQTMNTTTVTATVNTTTTTTPTTTVEQNTGITLTAEAIGNKTVKLNWQVSDELKKDAEGYRLTLGNDVNPTYPGKFWYERGPAHFDMEWTNLSIGKGHIRVCVLKADACDIYSNDVEVDVK